VKASLTIITIVMVLVGAGFLYAIFKPDFQQTALPEGGCTSDAQCPAGQRCISGACVPTQPFQPGEASSLLLAGFDLAGDSRTQSAVPLAYVWDKPSAGGTSTIIANGNALSASSRTSIQTSTGRFVDAIVFNESNQGRGFYGILKKDVPITLETQNLDLEGYRAASCGGTAEQECAKVTFFKDGTGYIAAKNTDTFISGGGVNITISAASTQTFDKIRFENNETDRAFRLGALEFFANTSSAPLDTITVGEGNLGGITRIGTPRRHTSRSQVFTYQLNAPKLLLEYQSVETGTVAIKTTGACSTAQQIHVQFLDWGEYLFNICRRRRR
jgi:Cys-rich repeat protein